MNLHQNTIHFLLAMPQTETGSLRSKVFLQYGPGCASYIPEAVLEAGNIEVNIVDRLLAFRKFAF